MPNNPLSKNYSFFTVGERYITESRALFATNTIRTFAESLIGIYVPVFLFTEASKNFNFSQNLITNGILVTLLFSFLKTCISIFLMHSLVNLIAGRFKFKKSILIGNILIGIGLFFISLSQYQITFFFLSSIMLGVGTILYWIPYHTYFIRAASSPDHKYGKNIGTRQILSRMSSVLGPLVGAIVIAFYGFNTIFLLSFVIFIISGIPLFLSNEEHEHGKHNSIAVFKKYFENRRYTYDTIAFAAMGVDGVLFSILSPILIWQIGNSVSSLGIITTLSIGVSSLIALKVGKSVDKNGPENLQKIGISINTFLYLLRSFVQIPFVIYSVDLIDRVNNNLFTIPFVSSMYTQAKNGRHETDFIIYRSYITEIAVIMGLFASAIYVSFTGNWRHLFLLLAIISPLTYLIQIREKTSSNTDGLKNIDLLNR